MEEINVVIERHEQQLKMLHQSVQELKQVQTEIKAINETLVTLANELKHTNKHLARQENKIDEMEQQPKRRLQQIVTAIISALSGAFISAIMGWLIS